MTAVVKSFSVFDDHNQPGDMFYIKHSNSNFTIIDCCVVQENREKICREILTEMSGKDIVRFISTHPDEDHICGLDYLDSKISIKNFYCVKNNAIKQNASDSFKYYCKLRDNSSLAFYLYKGCTRLWMNKNNEENYGSAEINCLWPVPNNQNFKGALDLAAEGKAYNNISPILICDVVENCKMMWMGDLEKDFVENIKSEVEWPKIDVLFAPHHGRESGKLPEEILSVLDPKLIVIGEAESEHLNYYQGYNTITQNSAGDIVLVCSCSRVDVFVSSNGYRRPSFLRWYSNYDYGHGNYIGSLNLDC